MNSIGFTNEYNYTGSNNIVIKEIIGLTQYDTVTLNINGILICVQKPNVLLSFGVLSGKINIKTLSILPKTLKYDEYHNGILNMTIIPKLIIDPVVFIQPSFTKISGCTSIPNPINIRQSYEYLLFNYDKNSIQELILPNDSSIISHLYHEMCFIGITNTNLLVLCGDMVDVSILDDYILKNGITTVKIYGFTKLLNYLRSNKYITSINYISYD